MLGLEVDAAQDAAGFEVRLAQVRLAVEARSLVQATLPIDESLRERARIMRPAVEDLETLHGDACRGMALVPAGHPNEDQDGGDSHVSEFHEWGENNTRPPSPDAYAPRHALPPHPPFIIPP